MQILLTLIKNLDIHFLHLVPFYEMNEQGHILSLASHYSYTTGL